MNTKKAISKVRLLLGTISMSAVVVSVTIGLATPALAPSKADALQAITVQYANSDSLSDKQLVGLLQAVGFQGQSLKYAWAIAKKESNGQPLHHNGNRKTGDNSYGLFQVNMLGSMGVDRRVKYGLASNADLFNPVVNAQVAYQMSDAGKNWSAWKGVHNSIVKSWLKKYPYKAPVKAKAKVKALAKAKPHITAKHNKKH